MRWSGEIVVIPANIIVSDRVILILLEPGLLQNIE